ncbi:MAG TPA: hypothetical protein VGR70_22390 [Stellaceae bacterium]|nr:hypothetical protein [Stellaceae bacterium]
MNKPAYNESIRRLLADIAVLNPEEGPVELICLWFDDLYRPAQTRPDHSVPEIWEKALQEWRECFSDDELRSLARFHDTYASLVDALPTNWPGWVQDSRWQTVKAAAADALAQLAKLPH